MLTVWSRRTSSNVQALMWCIGELGLPYERRDAWHRYGGTDTPAFLAMNPNGTVPVLRDGDGELLCETGAILRYDAGRYGTAPLWPADSLARAGIDKWAEWSKLNVALNFTTPVFWRVVRTAPVNHDPAAIGQAVGKLDTMLDTAAAQLCAPAPWPGTASPWPTSSSGMCSTATSTSRSPAAAGRRWGATTRG